MNPYTRTGIDISPELATAHARCLAHLSSTGTWWTGSERAALAAEVRTARQAAGVAEAAAIDAPMHEVALPDVARQVVRDVAISPQALTHDFYRAARDAGVGEEAYVEAVAVAAFTVNLDVFARGIGLEPLMLPPVEVEREPPRVRPGSAREEGAWVATVPAGRRGGDAAKALYGETMMPFIIRALSLVPTETRMHIVTEEAQYLPLARFAEFDYRHHRGLSRPQVEVIAGRVSALNECFY